MNARNYLPTSPLYDSVELVRDEPKVCPHDNVNEYHSTCDDCGIALELPEVSE